MSRADEVSAFECRELIREKAFELADSGVFDDWEGVRKALCLRFEREDVRLVFASLFCRLDLEQRCRVARFFGPGIERRVARDGEHTVIQSGGQEGRGLAPEKSAERRKPLRSASKGRGGELSALAKDIAGLLANGGNSTAAQLARQLGTGCEEIQGALRTLLSHGEAHVAGRARHSVVGRSARLYAAGPKPETIGVSDGNAIYWPRADALVVDSMNALVRAGRRVDSPCDATVEKELA